MDTNMDKNMSNAKPADDGEAIQRIITAKEKGEQIEREPLDGNQVVFVVGRTGSGKSTIIALLLGTNLTAIKKRGRLCISAQDAIKGSYPFISDGVLSETSFPTKWRDTDQKIDYWDLPGFDDVSGPTHDIPQAFYIKNALSLYKRIKLLIVAPESDFEDRGGDFLKLTENLVPLIGEAKELKGSLHLIVSKASSETSTEGISDFIKDILKADTSISDKQRKIIEALCCEPSYITIFRKPQQEGPLNEDISHEIDSSVQNLKSFTPVSIDISLPASSKNLINDRAINFSKSAKFKILEIIETLHQMIKNEIASAKNYKAFTTLMTNVRNSMKKLSEITILEEFLKEVQSAIITLIPNRRNLGEELARDVRFLIFCQEMGSNIGFDSSFWCLKFKESSEILPLLTKIEIQNNDSNKVTVKGIALSLSEILSQKEFQKREEVEIICFNTLFLDANLQFPGVNLSIIAPTWKVVSPVIIDLSGEAPSPPPDSDSLDGEPGCPGQNGGDFVGIGRNFINMQHLKIDLDGGAGGKGRDGIDGKDGDNGLDGDREKVYARDSSVLKKKVKAQWEDGELRYALETIFTFSDTFYSEYESQGKKGQDGGLVGMGGCGGYGGYPGRETIIREISDQSLPKISKKTGAKGIDGESGKPGKGGKGGITYRGVYREAITLPALRGYFGSPRLSTDAGASYLAGLAKATGAAMFLPVLLAQGAVSGIYELASGDWSESVQDKKEEDGKEGDWPNEKNSRGLTHPIQKSDVDIKKLPQNYNNCLQEFCDKIKEVYCVDMSEIFSKILA